jgi:hypothetical protein
MQTAKRETKTINAYPSALILPRDGYTVVDAEAAAIWLSTWNYVHQRPIRPHHVANLATEMEQGRFRQKVQINFCCIGGGGVHYLVNGQHTLSAIVASKVPQLLSIVVTDVADAAAVADEFARHDTHLTRKLSESLVAHEIDRLLGVNRTELQWIASACSLYGDMISDRGTCSMGYFAKRLTNDSKLQAIQQYGRLGVDALRVMNGVSGKNNSYLTRRTTLACVMHVYQWSPEQCRKFYGEMSLDDGLRIGDPRKTLLEYFRERVTGGGGHSVGATRKITPNHYFILAQAAAFNAFITNRQLKILRFDKDAKEVEFVGPGIVRV